MRRSGSAIALTAAKVGAALTSAIWLVVAARSLGIGTFADMVLLLALAVMGTAMADAGISVRLAELVARQRSSARSLVVIACRRRAVTGAAAGALLVVAFLVATDGPAVAAGLFAVSVFATAQHTAVATGLRAAGRVGPEAVSEPCSRLLVLTAGSIALALGGGLVSVAVLYASADLATWAFLWWAATRRLEDRHEAPNSALSWRSLSLLAVMLPLATVYWRVDIWLLAILATSRDVALYGAAYRFLDAGLLPALAIASLTAPGVAGAGQDAARVARRYAGAAVFAVAPFLLVGTFASSVILSVVYGDAYEGASSELIILALAAVPSAAVAVLIQAVAVIAPRRLPLGIVGVFAANVVGNVLLVPRWGSVVAAVLTLLCQSALAVYLLWPLVPRHAIEVRVPQLAKTA